MSTSETSHPLISIGADVEGRSGRIGEVSKVIVDPEHDRIDGVVVKRGRFLATERVVPLNYFMAGDGAALRLDMDSDDFERLDPFDEDVYHAPAPGYNGPAGYDASEAGLGTYVALGPTLAFGGGATISEMPVVDPMPVVEVPSIREGDDVFDSSGEKVGEVHEFVIDPSTGQPVHMTLKQGFIFKSEYVIPADWIDDIRDGNVHLRVSGRQIEDSQAV